MDQSNLQPTKEVTRPFGTAVLTKIYPNKIHSIDVNIIA
jgi:hypothetical protein